MDDLNLYVGGELLFGRFRQFVIDILGPHMSMDFVDERELQYNLWHSFFKEQFSIDMVSRGAGKSEFDVWVAIYCAVFQPTNMFSGRRENEFLVISADSTTTLELNKRIADYFLESDTLCYFVPDNIGKKDEKSPRWNKDTLELNNGSKIHFRSVKTKRGLHVDRIIIDDPTTESSTLTDRQTEDFILGAVLPMGTRKEAIINFTGTPLRYTDILKVMSEKEQFKLHTYPLLDSEGNLTLPKSFTMEAVAKIKSTIGSRKFSAEYLLNPISSDISLIKQEWIENAFKHDLSVEDIEYDEVYLGVDFAFSDAVKADKSAFVDVGVSYNLDGTIKHLIILNIEWQKGLSLNEHWEKIELKYKTNRHDLVVMEENSIKGSVKDLRDLKIPFRFVWMGGTDAKLTSRDAQTNKQSTFKSLSISKVNAINRLAVMFEYGKIIIPYKTKREKVIGDEFMQECVSWALEDGKLVEYGLHPDSPVAFLIVNEVLRSSSGVA